MSTTHIPQRSSLVAQTADILARGIRSGEWTGHLPAEREICRLLGVSRPTVRAALLILQREGLLRTTRGQRRRIVASRKKLSRPNQPRVIGVLYLELKNASITLGELKNRFHAAGYEMRVHTGLRLGGAGLESRLNTLTENNPSACWILIRCPERVQKWFAAKKLPAFVYGSRFPGVDLTAFDLHHQAVCRHAVQALFRQGHRRILFLANDNRYAGDFRSEQGFREAFARSRSLEARPLVAYHDGTVAGIRHALESRLALPEPPTAIIVREGPSALTVFSHLVTSGRRVPEDISLISTITDKAFAHLTLDLASYTVSWNHYLGQVERIVLKLAAGDSSKRNETLIIPQFHKGESIAPPPRTPSQ